MPAGEKSLTQVDELYGTWFIDYASYVILERAVPHMHDGLKPVQRRILHVLRELDDGRLHKVANIAGNATAYHPHGPVAIEDAIVQLGQKKLLLDTQGNWGNPLTADPAAASRYIEARLSDFAREVLFSPKITTWQLSYDGRRKEPVTLPVKFPLVLAQGVEGIAVGLACRILPHNFIELCDASIAALRGESFSLVPDFPSGGILDASDYQGGARGGRVRVRARIEIRDRTTLAITEIPYGATTVSVMDSILAANEKGKLKIARLDDNTARDIEILVRLPPGADPAQTLQALYAFTECEVSIAPNSCVIDENRPRFLAVEDLVRASAARTRDLLQRELEIQLDELQEKWHFSSLEKIFIEKRVYRLIEDCETWEAVLETIAEGLKPHLRGLQRAVTQEDIIRLTEIRIKRISKYNKFKADELLKSLENEIREVKRYLSSLTRCAIRHFRELRERFGPGRERRAEITSFERVVAARVVMASEKLYVNRADGFAGFALKKHEEVGPCSRLDDFIVFRPDGTMSVSRVDEKIFVGKNPIHIEIYSKDKARFYTMIYRDGTGGACLAKKFQVSGVTRDKVYDLTRGVKGTRVLFLAAHDSEDQTKFLVRLHFRLEGLRLRRLYVDFDFGGLTVKSRGAVGNIVTRKPVQRISRLRKR
ncbi:MAG TPA: DNA gyrase/topoisomerase IV subunit A [Verrucomicrobiales bacterium]|nr:DNA gyrase/topoisomerase IV subunit A [Verrucomicrobiales bacterium]